MSRTNNNYLRAISGTSSLTDKYEPEGFTTYKEGSKSDQITRKQNNTILEFLIIISNKLDNITEQVQIQKKEQHIQKINLVAVPPQKLEQELLSKLSQLKNSDNIRTKKSWSATFR